MTPESRRLLHALVERVGARMDRMKRRFDSLERTPHTRCGTRAPGDGPEGIAQGDETLIQLMQREVARQARFALIAAGRVEHWLHYLPDDPAYAGVAHQEAE